MRRISIFLVAALSMMLFVTGCGKDKEEAKTSMPKEFSATMVSASAGQTVTMKVYMKPDKFRTDAKMAGSSTIARKDLNKAWTIITSQKTSLLSQR